MGVHPAPNLPGNAFTHVNNFFNSGARTSNEDQFTTKVDHNFSGAQRLSARYSQDKLTTVSANLWGNWMNPYDDGPANPLNLTHNGSADYTWTISPTTILNVRWGVARQWGIRTPFCQQCPEFKLSDFGFQGPIDTDIPPNFQPQGYQALGTGRSSSPAGGRRESLRGQSDESDRRTYPESRRRRPHLPPQLRTARLDFAEL